MKTALNSFSAACILLSSVAFPSFGWTTEWFETEGVNCSGSRAAADAVAALTGPPSGVSINRGERDYFFALISAAEFNSLLQNADQERNGVQLDKAKSSDLRNAFMEVAEFIEVPMLIKKGISLSTMVLPPLTGRGTNLMFNFLFAQSDTAALTLKQVAAFIAEGGRVYMRFTRLKREQDNNFFISIATEYSVPVGNESRTFIIQDCVYPLAVAVQEFVSVAPLQKPQYPQILKRLADGRWALWDTEENRYMILGGYFRYINQSEGFYFFEWNSQLVRVSFTGGPWQFMGPEDKQSHVWHNTYFKVLAQ
jgi:hypothetical protein